MAADRTIDGLTGQNVPNVPLSATDGTDVDLGALSGVIVVYAYPRTSPPDQPPIEGWDRIPGARGCTPQSKGLAAHCDTIIGAGASRVFGLSTQSTDHQKELVECLSLPFSILSDEKLKLADALGLPRFEADGMTLLTRITLILENGTVQKVFFPVENPADNAADVVPYLSK